MTRTLLLKNTRIPAAFIRQPEGFGGEADGDCLRGDLIIQNAQVWRFAGSDEPVSADETCDLNGQLIMPRLTEVHAHLDKCHTIDRLGAVGGDLMQAIESMAADKHQWTAEDVYQRANQGLEELYQSGCQLVRTHVDWSEDDTPPLAWDVIKQLAQQWQPLLTVQYAALTSLDLFNDITMATRVAARIARDGGVLGTFVFAQDGMQEKLTTLLQLANRFKLNLDFHVDEGLAANLTGLEQIADAAIASNYQGHILCGHVCSLMNLNGRPLQTVIDKVRRAGITIAALPTTNLYLQGRTSGTPDRRGITRIRELRAAGVPVTIGSDNVQDAFCPLGQHSPMNALSLACLTAHLDPPFADWLRAITTDAQRALGVAPTYTDGAPLQQLLISSATSTAGLVAGGNVRCVLLTDYLNKFATTGISHV
ncbi:hypothetical protein DXV75_01915 [Alteromonas aestuariivivens]|uniref:Amidohydrolase 3 domain-containing protein n=1 Tax=Alteromonas aestuariivivens TaxID=1938339 RepID=A0A3D8MED8_9ALTE|nr:amidohydrolase family protein [Alteromonas aestuariivivens]RDV29239.1 hypothetical protein DXV75_01915 [Alteromonas aestuariivivens]